MFGDASNDGYGCVAYLVQEKTVTLLFSRGHANSNRALTIPRLELEAAVMVSLMAHRLMKIAESFPRPLPGSGPTHPLYYTK